VSAFSWHTWHGLHMGSQHAAGAITTAEAASLSGMLAAQASTAQHSPAQTAQHMSAQHATAQPSSMAPQHDTPAPEGAAARSYLTLVQSASTSATARRMPGRLHTAVSCSTPQQGWQRWARPAAGPAGLLACWLAGLLAGLLAGRLINGQKGYVPGLR